jgi:hypothetical protein
MVMQRAHKNLKSIVLGAQRLRTILNSGVNYVSKKQSHKLMPLSIAMA